MSEVPLYLFPCRSRGIGFGRPLGSGRGYHEGRRRPRDTYPESCITKYTSVRRSTQTVVSSWCHLLKAIQLAKARTNPEPELGCSATAWSARVAELWCSSVAEIC